MARRPSIFDFDLSDRIKEIKILEGREPQAALGEQQSRDRLCAPGHHRWIFDRLGYICSRCQTRDMFQRFIRRPG